MKLIRKFGFVFIIALAMILAACSSSTGSEGDSSSGNEGDSSSDASSEDATSLSIGGGGTSGTYYYIGAGIANMFQQHDPSVKLNVEVTAAGLENSRLLYNGDLDLSQIDGATLTLFGEDNPDALENWRQVGGGHSQFTHIVVPEDSDIQKFEDIKGKVVSVGAAGSGNEVVVRSLLEMYGMTYDDFEPMYLNFAESVDAFKAKQLDAFIYVTGMPAVGITDLSTTEKFRFISLDDEVIEKAANGEAPGIFPYTLEAGFYDQQEEEVKSVAINAQLIVNKDFPDDLAYKFAKNMSENWETIAESHPAGEEWAQTEELLFRGAIVPFHKGAVEYYEEVGIWEKAPDFVEVGE